MHIEGKTLNSIAKHLMQEGIPTPSGKKLWRTSTIERYDGYTNRFNTAKAEYEKLQKEMEERKIKADVISGFMFEVLELHELPIEFDEKLWNSAIDSVTVSADERLVFRFKNGTEIEERL